MLTDIFSILCKNEISKREYLKSLGDLFLNSKSLEEALKWIEVLNKVSDLDKEAISVSNKEVVEYISLHYSDNQNLQNDTVIEKVNGLFKKYSLENISKQTFVEKNVETDDLPF